jgi:hypothetical protein
VLYELAVSALLCCLERVLQEHAALGELAREVVLASEDLALEFVAPRLEDVGPGLHRVLPAAGAVHLEGTFPAHAVNVAVDRRQRGLAPAPRARAAEARHGAQPLVAVAEDVRPDRDLVSHATLGRVASTIHGRRGVLDLDPPRRFVGRGLGH